MAENDESKTQCTGHDLFDLAGDKIGTVESVHLGDLSGDPQWLVVDTGVPGAKKIFVPAGEVRRSGDRLSVLHSKERVADSPKVEDEQALTQGEEGRLCRYYGLQYVASEGEPAEGCVEIEDQRPAG
jgi:hypothetical protein